VPSISRIDLNPTWYLPDNALSALCPETDRKQMDKTEVMMQRIA
jgi:hypothetical protein